MNDFFLDSNICIYAFDKSAPEKQQKAFELLKDSPSLSSQVIVESYIAGSRKLKLQPDVCEELVLLLTSISRIVEINDTVFRAAITLKRKYQLSFLDSLIVAAALNAQCTILYSEDMQHNQVIEDSLTIVNPFK